MLANVMKLGATVQGEVIFPADKLPLFAGFPCTVTASISDTLTGINELKSRALKVLHKLWDFIYREKPEEVCDVPQMNGVVELGFWL